MQATPNIPLNQPRGNAGPVLATFVEILPEAEYLLKSDPEWLRSLIYVYNLTFAFGHSVMLVMLTCLAMVLAPLIGMAAAAWSYMASVGRTAAVSVGRQLSDSLGYGNYVRTKATYVAWQRKKMQESGQAGSTLPSAGVRPSSRYPALNEAELGITDGSWMQSPTRVFNILFSWGFVAGTVLCASLTLLLAPFIGMFVGAISWAYSIYRTFSRAEGRLVTDILGVSDLLDQSTAKMLEEMGVTMEHPTLGQSAAFAGGSPPSVPGAGPSNQTTIIYVPNGPQSQPQYVAPSMAPNPYTNNAQVVYATAQPHIAYGGAPSMYQSAPAAYPASSYGATGADPEAPHK